MGAHTPSMKPTSMAARVLKALARKVGNEITLGRRACLTKEMTRKQIAAVTVHLRRRGLLWFSDDVYHLTEDGWSAAESLGMSRPLKQWLAEQPEPCPAWSSP